MPNPAHSQFGNAYPDGSGVPAGGGEHIRHLEHWVNLMASLTTYFRAGTKAARPATPPSNMSGAYYFAHDERVLYVGVSGVWIPLWEPRLVAIGLNQLFADANTNSESPTLVIPLFLSWPSLTGHKYEIEFHGYTSTGTLRRGWASLQVDGIHVRDSDRGASAGGGPVGLVHVVNGTGSTMGAQILIRSEDDTGPFGLEGNAPDGIEFSSIRRPQFWVKDVT